MNNIPPGYQFSDYGPRFDWTSEGEINRPLAEPANDKEMDKLEKLFSTLPKDEIKSLENYYKVRQRGYWTKWSVNNLFEKKGIR